MAVLRGANTIITNEGLHLDAYLSAPLELSIPHSGATVFDITNLNKETQYNVSTGIFTPTRPGWYNIRSWSRVTAAGGSSSFRLFIFKTVGAVTIGSSSLDEVNNDTRNLDAFSTVYLTTGEAVNVFLQLAEGFGTTNTLEGATLSIELLRS